MLSRLNLIGRSCARFPCWAQKRGAGEFSWLCFLGEINDRTSHLPWASTPLTGFTLVTAVTDGAGGGAWRVPHALESPLQTVSSKHDLFRHTCLCSVWKKWTFQKFPSVTPLYLPMATTVYRVPRCGVGSLLSISEVAKWVPLLWSVPHS